MRARSSLIAIQIFLILALIAGLSSGCAGNKTGDISQQNSNPPQIPPRSTFIIDFSDFNQAKTSFNPDRTPEVLLAALNPIAMPASSGLNALGDRSNWGFAALNVGFWNLAGTIGLAVPVAAFVESLKQTPVKQPDNSWIWTYSITVQGITYTAKLQGTYIDSGVRWDMYITKQNEFSDFLWYYGESNSGTTQGYWVLKNKPSKPDDLLRIDWHRNPADETGDIKYTNIVPNGPDNGGYISFTATKEQPYDRSYVIYNKSKNETTDIQWSSSSKTGRVKDSVHFGDDNWHYWDSNLNNSSGS